MARERIGMNADGPVAFRWHSETWYRISIPKSLVFSPT